MSWKDTSLCESGFVFDRAGSSFTPIYNFESPQVCFTKHSPSSIFDDLTKTPSVKLGSIQTYCVRAANPVGYKFGYRSEPGCKDITIAWESMVCIILNAPFGSHFLISTFMQVSGYVRSADTAGKLPTKEAIVEYSFVFGGKSYRGSTLTDPDGYYDLSILVSNIASTTAMLDYSVLLCIGTRTHGYHRGHCWRAQDCSIRRKRCGIHLCV